MNLEVPSDFVQPNFLGDIALVIIICLVGIQKNLQRRLLRHQYIWFPQSYTGSQVPIPLSLARR
jgi:hypothetical protein